MLMSKLAIHFSLPKTSKLSTCILRARMCIISSSSPVMCMSVGDSVRDFHILCCLLLNLESFSQFWTVRFSAKPILVFFSGLSRNNPAFSQIFNFQDTWTCVEWIILMYLRSLVNNHFQTFNTCLKRNCFRRVKMVLLSLKKDIQQSFIVHC